MFLALGQDSLRDLVGDVLDDLGVKLVREAADADLLLILIERGDVQVLSRFSGLDVPKVAVLPVYDDGLAKRAVQAGANACFTLDTPLEALRRLLGEFLAWPRHAAEPPT